MLGWAVTFLIIALIAAVLGFGGIAAASAGIAKILFFIFLVMCVIFFILAGEADEYHNRGATISSLKVRDYFSRGLSCAAYVTLNLAGSGSKTSL